MNSLTYLSRQFDVLASPRAPPSTPSEEPNSFLNEGGIRALQQDGTSNTTLKRVKTWSTKSFLFPPTPQPSARSRPKRSYSSPADIDSMGALKTRPPPPPPASPSTIRSKPNVESLLRRIFFVRVFILLWGALCSSWAAIIRRDATRTADTTVEEGTKSRNEVEEKAAEDESQDEKHVTLENPQPPHRPPNISFPSPPSADPTSAVPSLHRSDTDPIVHTESQTESDLSQPQTLPISPNQSAVLSGGSSRSSTPILSARKTPFHLPKTLVLDLDETLIHSTSRPIPGSGAGGSGLLGLGGFGSRNKGAGHMVEVVLGGRSTLYHVYKRPFVDYFLRKVSWFYLKVIGICS